MSKFGKNFKEGDIVYAASGDDVYIHWCRVVVIYSSPLYGMWRVYGGRFWSEFTTSSLQVEKPAQMMERKEFLGW